jgi:hypothetical protein
LDLTAIVTTTIQNYVASVEFSILSTANKRIRIVFEPSQLGQREDSVFDFSVMALTKPFAPTEAELHDKVSLLQRQLKETEEALEQLKNQTGSNGINLTTGRNESDDDTVGMGGLRSSAVSTSIHPPVGHRGYLFKWQDRSIGWGGTKWALRFVSLEQGKISYFRSHNDSEPRYVLGLRGCAVRDDGLKQNSKHTPKGGKHVSPSKDEVGAYFHVFSIYQRDFASDDSSSPDEATCEVVPLLRFSTPSLPEKMQWISLISESCAYCDTDAFLQAEEATIAEKEKRKEQQINMAKAMPQAARGTLPPLYFAPASPVSRHKRAPSGSRLPQSLYQTASGNIDAEKVDARSTKGYPQSKPMHRSTAPSYLSSEAPMQNYRGLFNLGIIVLVVSNARLLLDTLKTHGSVFDNVPDLPGFAVSHDRWGEYPIVSGFALMQIFIITAFCIEKLLSNRTMPNGLGMFLHHINAHGCLLVMVHMVWNFIDNPFFGALVLFYGVITWMKLLSYFLANEDYRTSPEDTHQATLALVQDLEPDGIDMEYPK